MHAWLQWFRKLSGPSKWGIVGTILTALGLIVGLIGLIPAFSTSDVSNPSVCQPPASIQEIKGSNNNQIGYAHNVTINSKPKTRKREVLQNPGSSVVLVLKEIDKDPKLYYEYALEEDKHLGWIPVCTEVKSLEEKRNTKDNNLWGMESYTKIEILEGEYKGKSGWVALSKIKSETVEE